MVDCLSADPSVVRRCRSCSAPTRHSRSGCRADRIQGHYEPIGGMTVPPAKQGTRFDPRLARSSPEAQRATRYRARPTSGALLTAHRRAVCTRLGDARGRAEVGQASGPPRRSSDPPRPGWQAAERRSPRPSHVSRNDGLQPQRPVARESPFASRGVRAFQLPPPRGAAVAGPEQPLTRPDARARACFWIRAACGRASSLPTSVNDLGMAPSFPNAASAMLAKRPDSPSGGQQATVLSTAQRRCTQARCTGAGRVSRRHRRTRTA